MFLYFGGCSFTEGQGLADHTIFPNDYPGNYQNFEDALKSGWIIARQKLVDADKITRFRLIEENNIDRTAVALKNAAIIFFKDKHNALNQKSLTIKLLDPSNVLARGYAILQNKNGIIMQAHQLKKGDKIMATTKDAVVNLITEDITKI